MATVTLSVPDISCDHCKQSIEGALKVVDGVSAVDVHISERTVNVSYDEKKVQEETIAKTIEDQGYTIGS